MHLLSTLSAIATLSLAAAACSDREAPTAPDSPIVLDSPELLSGGEGLLRSIDLSELELQPAFDSTGTTVPRRWKNFSVSIDGVEVDSWRVGPEAIAFRVPIAMTGTVSIEVGGTDVLPAFLSARRLGLVDAFRYDDCSYFLPRQSSGAVALVGAGDGVFLATEGANCPKRPMGEQYFVGSGRLLPPAERSFAPIETATAPSGGAIRMYAPGLTFVPGTVILERPVALTDLPSEPDLWRASVGREIHLLEPASCSAPPDDNPAFTVLEVSDGVCLTVEEHGTVRRGNEVVVELGVVASALPPIRFVRSSDGRSVPVGMASFESSPGIPVFDAEGRLDHTIDDFAAARLEGAVFSDAGDLYLAGGPLNGGSNLRSVVERRNAATGTLLERRIVDRSASTGFNPGPVALTLAQGRLWLVELEGDSYSDFVAVLRGLDAENLTVERSIYLARPAIGGDPNTRPPPQPGSVIAVDPTGRRAYISSYWDQHLFGFVVDVY